MFVIVMIVVILLCLQVISPNDYESTSSNSRGNTMIVETLNEPFSTRIKAESSMDNLIGNESTCSNSMVNAETESPFSVGLINVLV